MKKLINAPGSVVPELLEGTVLLAPGLAVLDGQTVVVRIAPDRAQVALISGGGAGHEPAHAGYVGAGMLSAAVVGDVFTSPSTDAVLAAIRAVAGPAGVLLIVKNYTGDRLNFGLAAEIARSEGIAVGMVVVADDVALPATSMAGRRGIAGTILVHKIAGATAAEGLSLAEVTSAAREAAGAVASMGVGLSACVVPAAATPGFTLGENEIELGLGIHGESGTQRIPHAPADTLVATLLDRIVADRGYVAGDRVAMLVNNLGGSSQMEMDVVVRAAVLRLRGKGLVLERCWRGAFLTAIEMAGCSLSLLKIDDQSLARLDSATDAPAWPAPWLGRLNRAALVSAAGAPPVTLATPTPPLGSAVLEAVCAALTTAEARLTALDQAVGDGDLGISLARGAAAIRRELPYMEAATPPALLRALSGILRRTLGGTSGPLYAVSLLRASASLDRDGAAPLAWARAWKNGCDAIGELGGAKPGDRTMLDALVPAAEAFDVALAAGGDHRLALADAADAAETGAAATVVMSPRSGRSSYIGDRAIGHVDPGAVAVAVWTRAVANSIASGPI